MKKFLDNFKSKLTVGNVLTIVACFIFAIVLRYLYSYLLGYLPVRGELGMLDVSYFGMVALFRLLFVAYLEYLLDNKFSIPLFTGTREEHIHKVAITLNMVDKDSQQPSPESSSGTGNTRSAAMQEMDRFMDKLHEREQREKTGPSSHDKDWEIGDKMWDVLLEQERKLLRLHSMKIRKDVEFYEEDGGLQVTVPASMPDDEAKALSKEVGALDRSLQNKFSEYSNLRRKAAVYKEHDWHAMNIHTFDHNQKLYKELFEQNKTEGKKK